MFKTNAKSAAIKLLAATALVSAGMTAAPAHAGLLDSVKKMAKKELSKAARKAADSAVESTLQAAGGKIDASWKTEEGESAAPSGSGGFRQEPGTTVPTADDVLAPEPEQQAYTAGGGGGAGKVSMQDIRFAKTRARAGMSQNGTTVETANTVQTDPAATAADAEPQDAFMYFETGRGTGTAAAAQAHNPRNPENVQASEAQRGSRPQRAKLSQNGTTVATASEVQAPQRPQRAKLSQNGTTVATASEVQAPQRPQQAKLKQVGTRVATASEVQAPQGE